LPIKESYRTGKKGKNRGGKGGKKKGENIVAKREIGLPVELGKKKVRQGEWGGALDAR